MNLGSRSFFCSPFAVRLAAASSAGLLLFALPASAQAYEGYGYLTSGGAGGDVYHVTSLADSGAGTLRNGITNRSGPRTIVFDVAGTITLLSELEIKIPYLTVDGSTAPSPGITMRQSNVLNSVRIGGTHDIVIKHIRFQGAYSGTSIESGDTIEIDGDSSPDHVAQRIVLDHLSLTSASDGGPDMWGEIRDVSISWCFIYLSPKPTTVSHHPSPYQVRQRISMHHNVYARNTERNPQIRADVRSLDFVNNIIYDWGYGASYGYGIRIRNESGEPKVNGNFVNNAIIAGSVQPSEGLVYGTQPGPDSTDGGPSGTPAQGTVVTTSKMGSLWVSGNMLPSGNRDHYSTIAAPISVPASAKVTTWPAAELGSRVLPTVGMKYRNTTEQGILSALASKFPSGPTSKAVMQSPAPGSTLTSSTVTFTWSAGTGVTAYWLEVGTTLGGKQIYPGSSTTALSAAVPGLPTNGGHVYARLWSLINNAWVFNDYTYTATSSGGSSSKAVMKSPAPGSTLTSSAVTFTWSGAAGAASYWLEVGTTLGGKQIYPGANTTALSATVSGLPTNGSKVYARLWSLISGTWVFNDYTYTATTSGGSTSKAVMQSPAPGSTLASSAVTFTWSAATGATSYWLEVGTTVGGKQIYPGSNTTALSAAVSGLPTNGSKVYVRLWSFINAAWVFNDYTYTATTSGGAKAVMQSPAPGSTLTSSTVTFTWSAGTGVASYWLEVGTTLGGTQIYPGSNTTALSAAVSGLPTNGSTLYMRLWSRIGGSWLYNDYTYKAVTN